MLKLKQKELNKNHMDNYVFNNQNKFDELKLQLEEKPIFKLNTPELSGSIIDKEQITATKAVIFAELENYKEKTQRKINEMQQYYLEIEKSKDEKIDM